MEQYLKVIIIVPTETMLPFLNDNRDLYFDFTKKYLPRIRFAGQRAKTQ